MSCSDLLSKFSDETKINTLLASIGMEKDGASFKSTIYSNGIPDTITTARTDFVSTSQNCQGTDDRSTKLKSAIVSALKSIKVSDNIKIDGGKRKTNKRKTKMRKTKRRKM